MTSTGGANRFRPPLDGYSPDMTPADYQESELQLRPLLSELDEDSSPTQCDRAIRLSETVSRAAFEQNAEIALEDVHRSLFHLYSRRVWNAPSAPLSAGLDHALQLIRDNLEREFRESLASKRDGLLSAPPADRSELASWFAELATGTHPHENPQWPAFIREEISLEQLKQIVSHRSLFFLREPDPWIYAVPTLAGVAKAGLMDLLLDEYGWGKLDHMHSTIYAKLMESLGLETALDHYEPSTPWQFLATQNHQWMLALTPGLSRQLLGTIYLTEADSPAAMNNYLAAWKRLEISDADVIHFYELHVTADENHRDVALQEVLMPVCDLDPNASHEIACGIFDGKSLEADYANNLLDGFERLPIKELVSTSSDQG